MEDLLCFVVYNCLSNCTIPYMADCSSIVDIIIEFHYFSCMIPAKDVCLYLLGFKSLNQMNLLQNLTKMLVIWKDRNYVHIINLAKTMNILTKHSGVF